MSFSVGVKIDAKLFSKRGHARVMRAAFRDALTFQRDQIWPTHFENNDMTRPEGAYGYEKRSKRWQIKKAKLKGHQKPLVFTGALRNSVINNSVVRSTQHRGTLKAKSTFPMTYERRREIEAVTSSQIAVLRKRIERFYVEAVDKEEFKERVRLRDGSGRFVSAS